MWRIPSSEEVGGEDQPPSLPRFKEGIAKNPADTLPIHAGKVEPLARKDPSQRIPRVWDESGSSIAESDRELSDVADSDVKFGDNSSQNRGSTPEVPVQVPPLPLLKASPPMPVESSEIDRYAVQIRRASLKQNYGVSFDASESRDKRLWAISIAEELPHLGISKGDQVVSLNRIIPRSVDECREILARALTMDLVLQRRLADKTGSRAHPLGRVGGVLLSVTRATVTDARIGEFRLSMQRSSQRQRFGLIFEPSAPKQRGDDLQIVVADDMPHLALLKGDRLISLNGVRARSKKVCMQILKTAMSLNLVMRRETEGLLVLSHDLASLDTTAEEATLPAPGGGFLGCMSCAEKDTQHELQYNPPQTRPWEGEVIGFDAMGGPLDASEQPCCFGNGSFRREAVETA